jgi:hypothetical protein
MAVDRFASSDCTAALALAVAHDLNCELTVFLNSVHAGLPADELAEVVEQASVRCEELSRRLLEFADRRGARVPVPLSAILDREAA